MSLRTSMSRLVAAMSTVTWGPFWKATLAAVSRLPLRSTASRDADNWNGTVGISRGGALVCFQIHCSKRGPALPWGIEPAKRSRSLV